MSIIYKGLPLPPYVTVLEVGRPVRAPITWESFSVSGLAGVIPSEKTEGPISIRIRVLVEGKNRDDYERNLENFSNWMEAETPEPLVFANNPLRTYFALPQGNFDPPDGVNKFGKFSFDFFCPDPYKYAPEKTAPFTNGVAVLDNKGSVPVGPVVVADVIKDVDYMDVFTDTAFMRIGEPAELGKTAVKAETRLMDNGMDNMTGWTYGGLSVDGGTAAGTFVTDGNSINPKEFGTGTTWHGPAIKQAISGAPLTDWRVEYKLAFNNVKGKYGRVELYLLDDQGNHIGKLAIWSREKVPTNTVEIRIGGGSVYTFIVNDANNGRWNNFSGILQLSKKGNVFEAYVAQIDGNGKHNYSKSYRYVDTERKYSGNLSQIQLHAGVYNTLTPIISQSTDVEIYRYNEIPKTDPRIIALAGDKIELDFPNSAIYVNGKERKDLKDFAATFFKMPKGTNALLLEPANSFNATAKIREGFR